MLPLVPSCPSTSIWGVPGLWSEFQKWRGDEVASPLGSVALTRTNGGIVLARVGAPGSLEIDGRGLQSVGCVPEAEGAGATLGDLAAGRAPAAGKSGAAGVVWAAFDVLRTLVANEKELGGPGTMVGPEGVHTPVALLPLLLHALFSSPNLF